MSVKVHNTKTLKRSQTTINGLNIWSDIDFIWLMVEQGIWNMDTIWFRLYQMSEKVSGITEFLQLK